MRKKLVLGVDVDGVLANFNDGFIKLCVEVTGRDLFPTRPFDIPCWNYPEFYGYTHEELTTVWETIEKSPTFWKSLPAYEDTINAVRYIREMYAIGSDIYFVTSRPGKSAKVQTEEWLRTWCLPPTVLISSAKGLCSRALGFDAYIDDRWENALDVSTTGARSVLMDRPWNRGELYNAEQFGIVRTSSVVGFAELPPVATTTISA